MMGSLYNRFNFVNDRDRVREGSGCGKGKGKGNFDRVEGTMKEGEKEREQ